MALFKIYDCTFGVKYNSVSYNFTHVAEMQIENPETTKLIRGANGGDNVGLAYKEGLKEAKRITVTIIGMSSDLKAVLDTAYVNKDRLDVFMISKVDGSSKMAKNAVLSAQPQQLNISESPESLNIALAFESFDLVEVHKS